MLYNKCDFDHFTSKPFIYQYLCLTQLQTFIMWKPIFLCPVPTCLSVEVSSCSSVIIRVSRSAIISNTYCNSSKPFDNGTVSPYCSSCIALNCIVIFNPLSPHYALKHHFTSLKTDLIFLQPRVLERKFSWNWFTNTLQFSFNFKPH